jgi:hypothetical protein
MAGSTIKHGCCLWLALAVMAAGPAGAQRLATYETRSIILLPEQVEELAGRAFWAGRLSSQSRLTLVGGVPAPEALLAAISTWPSRRTGCLP